MRMFVIERNFAEKITMDNATVKGLEEFNDNLELNWLLSFLSADGKRTYCVYEAEDDVQLMEHAKNLGIPADEIVEVSQIDPKLIN